MENVTSNISGKVRRAKLFDRDYLVAPLSMLVPGVLNGSQGAIYYPPEEVARAVDSWNGMPITIGHPILNDRPVSARSPEVMDKFGVGFVFGSVFNSKLSAEGWFDTAQLKRVNSDVLSKLQREQPIELSTGLFLNGEQAPPDASFEGKPYSQIARNHRPDHLAILPGQVGACSLDDGCGVNNKAAMKCPECGHEMAAMNSANPSKPGETNVNKDQLIRWLTANCSCWKGDKDGEILNALPEDKLKAMKDAAEATLAGNTLVANLRAELEAAKATANAAPALTAEQQETLNWANQERARQKALLVERLLVNVTDPAKRQERGAKLMTKPQAELQELVELLPTAQQAANAASAWDFTKPIPHYAGAAGGPAFVENDDPNDVIPLSVTTYDDPRTRRQA